MSVDDVMSRMNPLVQGVLRAPGLHWVLSPFLMLVTVTGRRSGRRYTIPVGYQLRGDDVTVLVSEARKKQWWRNYTEPRPVEVFLRGRARRGEAALVLPATGDDYRERVEYALRRVPGLGGVFGVEFDRRAGLSAEQVEKLAEEIAVVRIDLERGSR
ncbi:MAG: nitroreductase family deazaflavin-dependent oxidoreductase [Deltaproteobacteria bacterium]|nr:nitroreductase family deazaflavin-dependent oxidoreductase [Deltaproteobacteria bacterium]MBW2447576.1 nitroreductase family deazaflavin-dependent oxidoreductase [Deltaproteobacteria bacterium]